MFHLRFPHLPTPWPMLMALAASIPAFYDALLPTPESWAESLYVLSALMVWLSAWSARRARPASPRRRRRDRLLHEGGADVALGAALLVCALLPPSHVSRAALGWRLAVALLTLGRVLMLSKPLFARTGLARLLAMAAAVLGLCGIGYYWIDPEVTTLSDGLWLAFTTAATVGYGDLVPSSTASRIFSMFVVLLGYGVLSLVTASIAAMFVDTQERQVERDILRGLHTEIASLRQEIIDLRAALDAAPPAAQPVAPPAPAGLAPQPAADTARDVRPAPARGLPRQPADETRA